MPDVATPPSVSLDAPRLVRACFGEVLDRPPVWLMRQAGRYMPEYQAVRAKSDFITMCKTPDLAVDVSLQPYRAFGMDAVIVFSDILFPCEAMGMTLQFTDKVGPSLHDPLRSAADIDRLIIPDPIEKTGFVMDALRTLRAELSSNPDTALIGFAGSPWTLASYMIEGGSSKMYVHIKSLMYNEPQLLHRLLGKLSETIILYLNAQIDAGVHMVQLFDSWGGIVSPDQYREFILPYQQQVFAGLNRTKPDGTRVPVTLYVNGSNPMLELMAESGADVLSIDWQTPLAQARQRIPKTLALQGNLDPNALFAKPEVLGPMIDAMLADGGNTGYIANLGHGVLQGTPTEHVRFMVQRIQGKA
jgi:uroporphyrinogen decarboxylase